VQLIAQGQVARDFGDPDQSDTARHAAFESQTYATTLPDDPRPRLAVDDWFIFTLWHKPAQNAMSGKTAEEGPLLLDLGFFISSSSELPSVEVINCPVNGLL